MKRARGKTQWRRFGSLPESSDSDDDYSDTDYHVDSGKSKKKKHACSTARKKKRKSGDSSTIADSSQEFGDWCNLPLELWVKIFSDVVQLEGGCLPVLLTLRRVCLSWHEIALTPSLWRTVSFSRGAKTVTASTLSWLAESYLHHTCDLNLDGCRTNLKMEPLVEHCEKLVGLTVPTAEMYLQFRQPLKRLSINQCPTRHFYKFQGDMMKGLTHLRIGSNDGRHDVMFAVAELPQLEVLFLEGFVVDWVVLVENCSALRQLTLVQCVVKRILTSLEGLLRLEVCSLMHAAQDAWSVWNEADAHASGECHLVEWLAKCLALRDLTLTGKTLLWKYANALFQAGHQVRIAPLRRLTLRSVPCNVVIDPLLSAVLVDSCSSLEFLEVTYLTVEDALSATELPSMRRLQLDHCSLTAGRCLRILDACPRLQSVSFAGNYRLPRGAKQAFDADRFAHLRGLLEVGAEPGDLLLMQL